MKKLLVMFGGIAIVLFIIFSSTAVAAPKSGEARLVQKQEKIVKHQAKGTGCKVAQPAVKKEHLGTRIIYVKVKEPKPWYFNPLILWVGGGLLLIFGGVIGRIMSFGPIPRPLPVEEANEEEYEGSLKKFFSRFCKGGACQPVV